MNKIINWQTKNEERFREKIKDAIIKYYLYKTIALSLFNYLLESFFLFNYLISCNDLNSDISLD